jgi:chromosomal replication initiation ATPase DnaA
MGVAGASSKHLSQSSLQVTGERVGTDQRDTEALWSQVLGQLQLQMARGTFDTWLKDTRLIARKGSKFIIAVGNGYAKEWLENRLLTTIQRTLIGFIKTDGGQKLTELEIEFVVKGC